ncbi:MAG: histidine--tRNA ligase [Thermodesulfobacteriota bacterium]
MTIKAIRGFRDVLPEEARTWARVEAIAARVLRTHGYQEIRLPVLEKTELFARSIGESTDIVEKEMFTFPDRHGELLTLRPEATAGMVRAVLENNLVEGGRPLKLFFLGPMFRYERPQKGRQRQFHQLDVEAFNDPSPQMDAEIIVLLAHFLNEVGLDRLTVHVNSLGCAECRPAFRRALESFLRGVRGDLCPDCQRRLETNPVRVIDCKVPRCGELVQDAPWTVDFLCPDCRRHFDGLLQALRQAGVTPALDRRLVRGLDYYTRTIFEVLHGELGSQNAVAGGGRYDDLARSLGGPDIPATGFALGLERLVMLLGRQGHPAPEGPRLYVAALDEAAVEKCFGLVQELRRRGFTVETDYMAGSLKSRLKRADKLGALRVLIVGPDEIARGEAVLRDMATKEQVVLPWAGAIENLAELLDKGDGS